MKLTKTEKKYIKEHYRQETVLEMATHLSINPEQITSHLKKLGKNSETTSMTMYENLTSFNNIMLFIKSNMTWLLLAIFLTVFVYFNSLGGDFISDDIPAFVENPLIRNFNSFFSDPGAVNVQKLFYVITFNLFGMSSIPIHMMSLFLHVLMVILVLIFISMLFGERVGVMSALLFAVHPVNTEAVSWMSGVFYIMTAIVSLITMIAYMIYLRTNVRVYYWVSIFIFLGYFLLNRHPWTLTITPLIFLLDLYVFRLRDLKPRLIRLAPFVFVGIFIVFIMASTIGDRISFMESTVNNVSNTRPAFTTSIAYTISESIKLYVLPFNLTFYHEGDTVNSLAFIISATLLGLIIISIFKLPKMAFLIGVYLISISLCLSPIRVAWYLAERYMYFGTVAYCALLSLVFIYFDNKFSYKRLSVFLTAFVLILFSVKTISRNFDWRNQDNLWIATVRVSPNSPKAHLNLADVYFRRGEYKKALDENKLAEALEPNYAAAIHNAGIAYLALNELDLAEANFLKTIQIDPSIASSYFRLGLIENQRGNRTKAIEYFNLSLKVDPSYVPASNALKSLGSQ